MRRRADWEQRLDAYLNECQKRPFQWGRHDCVLFACGAIQAMTGEHPLPDLAGSYASARGAACAMRRYSDRIFHRDFEAAIAAQCFRQDFEEVEPAQAQRGDLVLVLAKAGRKLRGSERGALGIIGLRGLPVFVDRDGLLEAPLESMRRAWRV